MVDASVALAALIEVDRKGSWALAVLAHDDLVAPHVLPAEVTSALRGLVLRGRLRADQAHRALEDAADWQVELYPFAGLETRVWELRDNLTPYDAWYVALAELLEVPLATFDRRLAAASGPRCEFLMST
ncbi:MAG: type II toxin-antitoxin system VapC family toxin [Nocardioides sp.]